MCVKGFKLCLQWSGRLCVIPCDGKGVLGWSGGLEGDSCNVASAQEIFMYLLDRREVCVCEGSLVVSEVEWSSLCNSL